MIKLKSLLKEQAEFKTVTTALQTAVKTFNDSAATVLANEEDKSVMTLAVDTQPVNTMQSGEVAATQYKWQLQLRTPGKSFGVALVSLEINRYGSAEQYTNIGYNKLVKLYEMKPETIGANTKYNGKYVDIYSYNANINSASAVNVIPVHNNINSNFSANQTAGIKDAGGNAAAIHRNTAAVISKSGLKLFEDLKSIFNSIEIAPFTPEGKKTWKGMKKV